MNYQIVRGFTLLAAALAAAVLSAFLTAPAAVAATGVAAAAAERRGPDLAGMDLKVEIGRAHV